MEVKDETIVTQEESTSQNDAEPKESLQTAEEQQSDGIPQKFVGKSPMEIIKAYNELHSSFGKVTSERAEERRQREQMEQRMRDLESQVRTPAQTQSQQVQEQEETDFLSDYDKQFEEDPKEAIKGAFKKIATKTERAAESLRIEQDKREAAEYYHSQKKSNQDFATLEPVMQQLAQEYGDLVRADKSASVKTMKLLHLAARGANIEKYEKQAVERAKKEGSSVRQEKKAAFSESTRSAGDQKVDFSSLSLEDMEKVLGIADKS